MKILLAFVVIFQLLLTCSSYQEINNDSAKKVPIFSPSTIIQYSVSRKQNISVILYNTKGELLDTIVSGKFSKGNFEVKPVTNELESGVYFVKIIGEDTTLVKKIFVSNR